MAKVDWTYQVPPAGGDSAGLEEYSVESASGARVGKVMTLLRRDGETYLAVERGTPPVKRDLRAFPWEEVEQVDHSALTVRLKLRDDAVEESLELDSDKGTESGDAEAVRVTDLPASLVQPETTGETAGPTESPSYLASFAFGALGIFSLLVIAIAATAADFTWEYALFVIPAVLLALSAVAGYRLLRRPHERA